MNRSVDACECGSWHFHLWPKGEIHTEETECKRMPFVCRSWRHAGECRLCRGAMDWCRIREGLKKRQTWIFATLTFEQPEDKFGRWQTYFRARLCWDCLRKRMTRYYGRIEYISTWERHTRGGCHGHIVLGSDDVICDYEFNPQFWLESYLSPEAYEVGFGWICHATIAYDNEGLAGYLTKLANELTGSGTKSQIPLDAPPHFRRIRASRGLLPKKPSPEFTGELVRWFIPEYNPSSPPELQPCGCSGEHGENCQGQKYATDKRHLEASS